MNSPKTTAKNISPSPFVLLSLIVVVVLIFFALIFGLFSFQRPPVDQVVGGAQRATDSPEGATVTAFPDAPTFPNPPTGPAELLPTPDVYAFGTAGPIDESTDVPDETDIAGSKLPEATIGVAAPPLPPSSTFISFTDSVLKLSFEYPDNWFVIPAGPKRDYASLQNVDPSHLSQGEVQMDPSQFGVEIQELHDLPIDIPLENDVDTVVKRLPAGYLLSREQIQPIDGQEAIKIVYKDIPNPDNTFSEIFVKKNGRIYDFSLIPPNTKYTDVLNHFLLSIRLP